MNGQDIMISMSDPLTRCNLTLENSIAITRREGRIFNVTFGGRNKDISSSLSSFSTYLFISPSVSVSSTYFHRRYGPHFSYPMDLGIKADINRAFRRPFATCLQAKHHATKPDAAS